MEEGKETFPEQSCCVSDGAAFLCRSGRYPANFPAHLQTLIRRIRTRRYPGERIHLILDSKLALRKRRIVLFASICTDRCKPVKRTAVSLYSRIIFLLYKYLIELRKRQREIETLDYIALSFFQLDYAHIDQRETSRKIHCELVTRK